MRLIILPCESNREALLPILVNPGRYDLIHIIQTKRTRSLSKRLPRLIKIITPVLSEPPQVMVSPLSGTQTFTSIVTDVLEWAEIDGEEIDLNTTSYNPEYTETARRIAEEMKATILCPVPDTDNINYTIWDRSIGQYKEGTWEPDRSHLSIYANLIMLGQFPKISNPGNEMRRQSGFKYETVVYSTFMKFAKEGQIDDVERNVIIQKKGSITQSECEIDVVFSRNGKLGLISCRSGKKRLLHEAWKLRDVCDHDLDPAVSIKMLFCKKYVPESTKYEAYQAGVYLFDGTSNNRICKAVAKYILKKPDMAWSFDEILQIPNK